MVGSMDYSTTEVYVLSNFILGKCLQFQIYFNIPNVFMGHVDL